MAVNWLARSKQRLLETTSREYLLWGFGLFITGYFLMPKAAGHARLYYVLVLIPLLYNWRQVLGLYRAQPVLKWLLVFCCYLFVSSFWSEQVTGGGVLLAAFHALLVLSFPAAVILTYQWYPEQVDKIFQASIILAAVFALISMLVFYRDASFPHDRLFFWGRMDSPIKAACAYAFFSILAFYFSSLDVSPNKKILFFLAGTVILLALILCQSRGALLAFLLGLSVLLSRNHIKKLAALLLVLVATLLLFPSLLDMLILNRGFSFRPDKWKYTIDAVGDNWLWGIGFLSPTGTIVEGLNAELHGHAHSQLVATYRDGGLVAIAVFAGMWLAALLPALKLYWRRQPMFLALLVFGFICLIPYQDRLITRPREHWLYFWLPLWLLLAYFHCGKRYLGQMLENPR